jgi:hypothetical protein
MFRMKKNKLFGKEILFNEVLHSILYIKEKNLLGTKLITPVEDSIEVAEVKYNKQGRVIYQHSYRKIIFKPEHGKGIIIGQTTKSEGEYFPGYYPGLLHMEDIEQASLKLSKRYSFWIVATGMNTQVLVPKDSEVIISGNKIELYT